MGCKLIARFDPDREQTKFDKSISTTFHKRLNRTFDKLSLKNECYFDTNFHSNI